MSYEQLNNGGKYVHLDATKLLIKRVQALKISQTSSSHVQLSSD